MGKALDLVGGFLEFQDGLYKIVETSYVRFMDCFGKHGLIDAEIGLLKLPVERVDGLREGIFMYIVRGKEIPLRTYLTSQNIRTLERCLEAKDIREVFIRKHLKEKYLPPIADLAYWAERRREHDCESVEIAAYLDMEQENDAEIGEKRKKKIA